jgi:UDP-N-acetylmuramoyl-L-alanyl-D-glutamate--2,6-diaminopimelate ligase
VVIEREVPVMKGSGAIFIRVSDTRRALARLCNAFWGDPAHDMRLVAVTGTNGKTSVSTMLKAIFDAAMIPCGLIGTVRCVCRDRVLPIRSANANANMTTPDPAELYHMLAVMREEGVEVVVMETTSHALALRKLDPLHFDAAIFTNLTPEHLDFHGDMNHYFAAKASLFPKSSLAILNADDASAKRLIPLCGGRVVRTSTGGHDAEYTASDVHFEGVAGVNYTLSSPKTKMKIQSPIPGIFTLPNTLQAAACALEMGVSARTVRETLQAMSGVEGRLERVRIDAPVDFSVFIDYAHTPDALENLLSTARSFCQNGQRVVLVFGCGGDRDKTKRSLMGAVASRLADMVYVTSDNSRSEDPDAIIRDILAGIDREKPYRVVRERSVAIEMAIREAKAGDIILLSGKGHEKYEIDATGKHPFDEKAIVRAAAAGRFPFGRTPDTCRDGSEERRT